MENELIEKVVAAQCYNFSTNPPTKLYAPQVYSDTLKRYVNIDSIEPQKTVYKAIKKGYAFLGLDKFPVFVER